MIKLASSAASPTTKNKCYLKKATGKQKSKIYLFYKDHSAARRFPTLRKHTQASGALISDFNRLETVFKTYQL